MSDFLLQYHLSGFGTRRIESDPDWRFSAHTLADNDLVHVSLPPSGRPTTLHS
jgi:hypothetical protein